MGNLTLNIATEFSKTPGVRDNEEGSFSGEDLLNNLLLPRFISAIESGVKLEINLNGTSGYATSFLEASFGGLTRVYLDPKFILKNILFVPHSDPFLIDDIKHYINEALEI